MDHTTAPPAMPLVPQLGHRPEIDGLRAVAVIAVALFHAQLGLSGGFIGVDVFFVISGYLITSIICRDLQDGRFSFAQFWERRIRRILPALTVVVLATLIAGWWIQFPDDYGATSESAVWQSAFAGNVYFWKHTGYFARRAHEMALLHTWSLSVEEQFYLLAPAGIALLYALRVRRRRWFVATIGIGVAGSLLLSARRVLGDPGDTFFLLPTRAWELGIGCAVALAPVVRLRALWSNLLCIGGLAGIVVPCFLYTHETVFPGPAALPPCVGTALVIVGASRARASGGIAAAHPVVVARLLGSWPMVGIGLVSYSFYLWHWPVLVMAQYLTLEGQLSLGWRIAMLITSLALAIVSWRWIEQPFRRRTWLASRRAVYAFGGACLLATASLGLLIYWQHGVPSRFSPEVREFAAASEDRAFVREMEIADVTAGHLEPIGAHDSSKPPAVVVWGDSHAMAAMSAFDSWLRENGRSGWQATRSATPPLLDYWYSSVVLGPRSHEFAEGVIAFVTKHRVPNTVLVARWSAYAHVGHGDPRAALLKTIAALAPSGTRVWIVAEMPGHTFLVPHVLATASYRNIDYTHLQSRPDGSAGLLDDSPEWLSQLHASGVRILDARPLFIDRAGCYAIEQDGIALYRDEHHLSSAGAIQILKPLLRRTVDLNDESGAHTK